MADYMVKVYPKVFKTHARQTLYFKMEDKGLDAEQLSVRIHPMEQYGVLHTPQCRIDEEERYDYVPFEACGDGWYSLEYDFSSEQQYSMWIRHNGKFIAWAILYAVDEDLSALNVYKGDTHLHSCRSDGEGTPFEVSCAYRAGGYDFIAVTDHHKFAPSLEAQTQVKALTDQFYVFRGEEVHNKSMGYFHIVNFNGNSSVNDIIETDDAYVENQLDTILAAHDFSGLSDPRNVAYRMFVADHIHKAGGLAIMAHPFWSTYGEYNMQTEEFIYHWQHGHFDALEVLAGCDQVGHGNNLQETLRCDMMAQGYKIPVVGASDAHTTKPRTEVPTSRFNQQFSLVFAKDYEEIPCAIKDERSVAIDRQDDVHFRAVGKFRYVKYARFLMNNFYPTYTELCKAHGEAMATKLPLEILDAEREIRDFKHKFFAF